MYIRAGMDDLSKKLKGKGEEQWGQGTALSGASIQLKWGRKASY